MLLPNFFVQALILNMEEPTSNGVQEGHALSEVQEAPVQSRIIEGPALSGVEG